MMKIKSFFMGILLLIIVFIMVIFGVLIYRANERSNIKTYIFQMGNNVNQRVGALQDIDTISPDDLRNKLIKKYISEYFRVMPGDANVTSRPTMIEMSSANAFSEWTNGEAKLITDMSAKKMFRMARVPDGGIAPLHTPDDINTKTSDTPKSVYYVVHYETYTWPESNNMNTEPIYDQGIIHIEVLFEPGLREHNKYGEKINIRDYLKSNQNPVNLFRFRVTNIGSKGV